MITPQVIEDAIDCILSDLPSDAYLSKEDHICITRHRLPHWDHPYKLQHVTWRLGDSLPQNTLMEFRNYLHWLAKQFPDRSDYKVVGSLNDKISTALNRYLDAGLGSCQLADPAVRRILESEIQRGDGVAYDLYAYAIMPNHLHVVLLPYIKMEEVVNKWRTATAGIIVPSSQMTDAWMPDYFDRMLRSSLNLNHTLRYVLRNPSHCGPGSYSLWLRGVGAFPWQPGIGAKLT